MYICLTSNAVYGYDIGSVFVGVPYTLPEGCFSLAKGYVRCSAFAYFVGKASLLVYFFVHSFHVRMCELVCVFLMRVFFCLCVRSLCCAWWSLAFFFLFFSLSCSCLVCSVPVSARAITTPLVLPPPGRVRLDRGCRRPAFFYHC